MSLSEGMWLPGGDWTWSVNSRAGTYPGQGCFLIGETEIFTFLRGSWRARPSRRPRSGWPKPENLPTPENVGGIAPDRSGLQLPPLGPQSGVALAGPDPCRDRHNCGGEARGTARTAPARASEATRSAVPNPSPWMRPTSQRPLVQLPSFIFFFLFY